MFVGNLSFKTTKDDLISLLAPVGQPVDVYLPVDRATNKPRGFAFIEFADQDEITRAIAVLNGREVDGRVLKANAAEDRPRRSFGPGPGGPMGGQTFDAPPEGRPSRPKGSRRNMRARKRSL